MRVNMFVSPLIAFEGHCVSSHTGSIMTARNGMFLLSEEAIARRTALSMSFGSYSGLAIHEAVNRKEKELKIAPKWTSSGRVEQYDMPSVIEQLRGLPKSSAVVKNACSIAVRREG